MIDLTVSIVNHGHPELVEALIASIIARTRIISYEVFVVNNLVGDGSAETLALRFPSVMMLNNPEPLGFAANNNQVLRLARGRYTVLLNDDMVLANNALDRMVGFMDENASVGAIGCKLLNRDGTVQRSCWRGFPSAKTLLVDLFYLSKWLPQISLVKDFEATFQITEAAEVDYVLGACLLVRREVIEQVGILDESFGMFLEETDWCFRIRAASWRIFWVPDGEILHYGQQSVSRDPSRYVPMLYQNYCTFGRKHGYHWRTIVLLKVIIALGMLFRALVWSFRVVTGTPDSRAMVRGYLAAFFAAPTY